MTPSVYLETTIPSYYTARPSRDVVTAGHQATTREWWGSRLARFDVFISQIVIDEAAGGDAQAAEARLTSLEPFPLLEISNDAKDLARALLDSGAVPRKAARDALHIAIAAVHGIEYLVTWNFTHIANAEMAARITEVCHAGGVESPRICTPEELMGT